MMNAGQGRRFLFVEGAGGGERGAGGGSGVVDVDGCGDGGREERPMIWFLDIHMYIGINMKYMPSCYDLQCDIF